MYNCCLPGVKGGSLKLVMLAEQESFYKPWIEKDLQPWKENGITKVSSCMQQSRASIHYLGRSHGKKHVLCSFRPVASSFTCRQAKPGADMREVQRQS